MTTTGENPVPVVIDDAVGVINKCSEVFEVLSGKSILLTGGTGFIGSSLLEVLAVFNRNHPDGSVRVLLPTRSVEKAKVKWPHFFGNPHFVWFEWGGGGMQVAHTAVDFVIHGASPSNLKMCEEQPDECIRDMRAYTTTVIDWAESVGVSRILYLSSGAVYPVEKHSSYGIDENTCDRENREQPPSVYGKAKRVSEDLFFKSSISTVICRLFSFIGPYMNMESDFAVADFIRQAEANHSITLSNDGKDLRTYCYSSDMVAGIFSLLVKGDSGETYNLGAGGDPVSIYQVASEVAKIFHINEVQIGSSQSGGAGKNYVPDISKLKEIYSPEIGFREGLSRTVSALVQRGVLSAPENHAMGKY